MKLTVLPRLLVFPGMILLCQTGGLEAGTPLQGLASPKAPEEALLPPVTASTWNLTAGYQWRQIGSLEVRTGSAAAGSTLPWMAGRASRNSRSSATTSRTRTTPGRNVGSPTSAADRTYDNGYVNQDAGTPFFGDTWNWGYNDASQLQGNNLSYNATTGTTTTVAASSHSSSSTRQSFSSSLTGGLGWNDDLEGSGWFAQVESPAFLRRGSLALSADLGYSFASADSAQSTGGVFRARQESHQSGSSGSSSSVRTRVDSVTDTYDVSGIIVPTAPYQGTLAGPGPLISNVPANRLNSSSTSVVFPADTVSRSYSRSQRADFVSSVHESFEVNLHTISLGPRLSYEYKRVRLGLGLGLGLNIADWDADYEETLSVRTNGGSSRTLRRHQDSASGTEVLPGFYLEPSVQVRLTRLISLFASGRYDWADSFTTRVGPSSFDFEAGGWSAMVGITFSL